MITEDAGLTPPSGKINVAILLADGATMIDFAGPWEVFQDVHIEGGGRTHDARMPFRLYTVAETSDPIRASAGMRIVPDYSFENAPQPNVLVILLGRRFDRAMHR